MNPRTRRALYGALLLLLTLTGAERAWAACSVTNSATSLGTISSLSLITTARGAQGGGGLGCGAFLNLLTANYVRLTLESTNLVLSDGKGNSIPLRVLTRSGGTQLTAGTPLVITDLTVLALLTTANGGMRLYFEAPAGANVPAGTYTASVNLRWQYAICESGVIAGCVWQRSPGLTQSCLLNALGIQVCGDVTNWGTGSLAVSTVTLIVSKACVINSTQVVDFGSQALISQFAAVNASVSVTCTNTEGYTVGFDAGQNFSTPWRRMASDSNRLNYNLYFPSGSVWSSTLTQAMSGTGLAQSVAFRAIIDPSQSNVPAGTYTDNVTLIISY